MAIYNLMFYMMILFMIQSYGNGQMVKQSFLCGDRKPLYFCFNEHESSRLMCDPYHVIIIINVTTGYYNEPGQVCCHEIPKRFSTLALNSDNNLGELYRDIAYCVLSHSCTTRTINAFDRFDKYPSKHFISYIDYICVSNTTIINMTKRGMNPNLEGFSLAYNKYRYPDMDNNFYCSCDITADGDDVYIYTTVSFLGLNVVYNTSVTIYSRDLTVRYDETNTDMTHIDNFGYKYLVYKQLKQIKGPMHLVYEGDGLQPSIDKIWIDFKVHQGRLRVNCKGCQSGYSVPPAFSVSQPPTTFNAARPPTTFNVQTSQPIFKIPQTSPTCDLAPSSDIYKIALISVLVTIAILGLVMMGVVAYKKRICTKEKTKTPTEQPTISEPVSDMQIVSRTLPDIPIVSETGSNMYDTVDMKNQSARVVYESLEHGTVYENLDGDKNLS